jgi:hydroxyacylglutathione hydrolase
MSEPRIFTIRVPNPFVEGRNRVYVIADDPITMIDSGVATDRAFQGLVAGLKEHGLAPSDIKRIVLTHKHIDHIGNAWRFQKQCGAEIMIHERELPSVTDVDPGGERYSALVSACLDDWQVPADARPSSSAATHMQWEIESVDATPLVDGQSIPCGDGQLEVIHTPGHTMGSICLKLGSHVFSGDHVLPDISPNIGGGDMRSRNLLFHYLESLRKTRDLFCDEDVNVLPGHGDPMQTFTDRCDELVAHHESRLEKLADILGRHARRTVYDIACRLFGEMKGFHVVLGCAEANAHLELLVEQGRIFQEGSKFGLTE